MSTAFSLAPLFRHSVGFDRFNDLFESALRNEGGSSYPPYNVEKHALKALHPRFGRALGFRSESVRVQDCRTEDDLVSLIIASSCTPPFTPIEYRDGRPTMDGGLVDNVPVHAVDPTAGPTLVLTTRRYPRHAPVFLQEGRVYVQPSRKVPASSWDYTSVDRMALTYEQGREDGEAFLRAFAVRGAAPSQWQAQTP